MTFSKYIVDKLLINEKDISLKIENIEKGINYIEEKLHSVQFIIDNIFQNEFNFNYGKFYHLKTIKMFSNSLTDFSNNPDCRMSAKFHRTAGDFVMQELSNITTKRIKHYLAEPIVLGASISPSNYNDDGDTYYLWLLSKIGSLAPKMLEQFFHNMPKIKKQRQYKKVI